MKKIVFLLLLIFSTSFYAQKKFEYGIKAGLNVSTIKRSDNNIIDYSPRIGYNIGVLGEYLLNEKISLQVELLYSLQGAKFGDNIEFRESADSDIQFGNFDLKIIEDYLLIPVLVKYRIKAFNFYTGPQLGILLSSESKRMISLIEGQDETITIENDFRSSTDFSWDFGLGYKFDFGLFFDARYNLGLSNTIDAEEANAKEKSRVFQLSLGYLF